jgi:hypothetical protein
MRCWMRRDRIGRALRNYFPQYAYKRDRLKLSDVSGSVAAGRQIRLIALWRSFSRNAAAEIVLVRGSMAVAVASVKARPMPSSERARARGRLKWPIGLPHNGFRTASRASTAAPTKPMLIELARTFTNKTPDS